MKADEWSDITDEMPDMSDGGPNDDSTPEPNLPEVVANGRPLPDITAEGVAALVAANTPPVLFVRQGSLARVRADERGRPIIDRVTEALLRHQLARAAQFVKVRKRDETIPVPPPPEVVQDVLALGCWTFPALEGVVEVPILRPDGTVLDQPGYDPETRLIYQPRPDLRLPPIPRSPTLTEVRKARDVILDLIDELPFVDDASLANAVGLMLTPILRPAIAGQVPLALLDKPKRGTGASLLGQVITIIASGSETDLTTAPRDDEEWRKKITAGLLAGSTMFFFDDVQHTLSSPSLAAALTSPVWTDRVLGRSELARDLPQRATWIATGNNLKVGGDLARRSYWVRLDAQCARPWQRKGFRHRDLPRYVRAHRGELLAALLTLARGWFAAGCPRANVPVLGGFEQWTENVGGVLAFAGAEAFLANLGELYEQVDEDEVAWELFLRAWYGRYGSEPMTVAQVSADLRATDTFAQTLPGDLADALVGKGSFAKKFGKVLGKQVGAIFGSLRLEKAGVIDGVVKWRVAPPHPPDRGFRGFGGFVPPVGGDEIPVGGDAGDRRQTNQEKQTPETPETPAPDREVFEI
jgi:hypothetical protein